MVDSSKGDELDAAPDLDVEELDNVVDSSKGNELDAAPDLDVEELDNVTQDFGVAIGPNIFPTFPPQVEMYTREFVNQLGASNLIQMPIHLECAQNIGPVQKWTPQYASLFDIGATCSFIRSTLVEKYRWPIHIAPATVTNCDGSKSICPGVFRVKIRVGTFIKTVLLRVASLCKFDVIIGKDLIDECKMEVRLDPFRITALTRCGKAGIQ
jgi:hypothetical protein